MANFEQVERAEGMWNGKKVSFKRIYSGHRFTDKEVEDLLSGKEIEVADFVSAKTGKTYGAKGKLSNLEYNGNPYVGFERTGFLNEDRIPDEWCGHRFTEDEKLMLEAGKSVHIDGCKSKKGSEFSTVVTFEDDGSGRKKIVPEFAKNKV